MHDRLSVEREEHAAQELSAPGRTRRGANTADDHGDWRRPVTRRWVPHRDKGHWVARQSPSPVVHGRTRGVCCRHIQHAATAPQDERRRSVTSPVADARPPIAYQFRIYSRGGGSNNLGDRSRLHRRSRHHVKLVSGRQHARRACALRQRLKLDGVAAVCSHHTRCRRTSVACVAQRVGSTAGNRAATAGRPRVVRAHGDLVDHAASRQLVDIDGQATSTRPVLTVAADNGSRSVLTGSHLHAGCPGCGPSCCGQDRRHSRFECFRKHRRGAHSPLRRRVRDRRRR